MQCIQNGAFSNPQAERGLLGCWLTDWASAREIADFAPEDFTGQQDRLLFQALFALHQAGENYDPLLLEGKARTLGMTAEEARLVSIGAAESQNAFPLLVNKNAYARQVLEASKRRTLARNAQQLQQTLAEPTIDPEDALARFESNVAQKKRGADAGISLRGALLEALEIFERRSRGETAGILCRFAPPLDRCMGGLRPGELTVIGGRPGTGKSAFLMGWALEAAKQRKRTVVFSLEMSTSLVAERMISREGCIDGGKLRGGQLTAEDYQAVCAEATQLSRLPLRLDDRTRTIEGVVRALDDLAAGDGVDAVFVDYLQLLEVKRPGNSRYENLARVSRQLKEAALRLRVPIVAAVQVGRDCESRVPLLSDIRDSGTIEQDADNALFLYAPRSRDEPCVLNRANFDACLGKNQGVRYIVCSLAKQRNGDTGVFDLIFDGRHMDFCQPPECR